MLKKILGSEMLCLIATGTASLFVSFYPLFYAISLASASVVFPLIHNHNSDYFYYLSFIKQAYDGRWLFITRYSPESFPQRFTYPVYLVIGKLAKIFSLGMPVAYNGARFILAAGFVLMVYFLIRLYFPEKSERNLRKISLFTVLCGSGFVQVTSLFPQPVFNRFLAAWTEVSPIEKIAYIPHHLAAKILLVGSLYFLIKSVQSPTRPKMVFISALCAFFGAWASPFVIINLEIILWLGFFLYLPFRRFEKNRILKIFVTILIISISAAIPLAYYRWLENSSFPWNHYLTRETLTIPVSPYDLLMNFGPNFILTLPAVALILWKKRRFADFLFLAWIIQPWLGTFILSRFIPLINARFLSSSYIIPLGILASEGLITIANTLTRLVRLPRSLIVLPSLVFLFILYSADYYANIRKLKYNPRMINQYLPRDVLDGFAYLDRNTPPESVVLTGYFLSTSLPAYTHNKSFTGYETNTYDYPAKTAQFIRYFSHQDIDFTQDFFKKNNIEYVFYGPDAGLPPADFVKKLKMDLVYKNPAVEIYKTVN